MRFWDPLVVPLAALVAGIVVSRQVEFDAGSCANALAALVLLAILAKWKGAGRAALAAALAAIFVGGILADVCHRPGPAPEIEYTPGEVLLLEGCVVEPPSLSENRQQLILELAERARARLTWYLKPGETAPDLAYGQRIQVEARLRKPRNFLNEGSFDIAGYLARRDIYWLASANARSPTTVLEGRCGSTWRAAVFGIRTGTLNRLDRLYPNNEFARGMSRALLVGDAARLERAWVEEFRRTGTYHALVISGMHLAILGVCFLFLMKVVRAGVITTLVVTSSIAWVYALIAGGNAPVVRAAAGLTLYLAGRCLYRRGRVLNLLAGIAIVFLLADPDQLFDPSFQLSFLSVGLIGAFAVPILEQTTGPYFHAARTLSDPRWDVRTEPRLAAWRVELRLLAETIEVRWGVPAKISHSVFAFFSRVGDFFWSLLVVSLVAQLGLALPMVVYFHRFSLTGLTANLIIVPVMNTAVVLGFLAVATGWGWLAGIVAALLAAARAVAAWHAVREPAWRVPDPPGWLLALFLVALVAGAVSLHLRLRWRLAATVAFAATLATLVAHPFPPRVQSGMLEFITLDVGQGDSHLLIAPDGRALLADAGGLPAYGAARPNALDIGEEVVSNYLFARAIRRLDVVVVSHGHEDHMGGLRAVIRNFRPREIWTGALPETPDWVALREEITARGIRLVSPRAGERLRWGEVKVDVLAPPVEYQPGLPPLDKESPVAGEGWGGGGGRGACWRRRWSTSRGPSTATATRWSCGWLGGGVRFCLLAILSGRWSSAWCGRA